MTRRRMRLAIHDYVIAIAVVAVPLAIAAEYGLQRVLPAWTLTIAAAVLALAGLAVLFSRWLVADERRRLALVAFWSVSGLVNLGYVGCCTRPCMELTLSLAIGWLFVTLPVIVGLGVAWAQLANRGLSRVVAHSSMFAMAILPAATLITIWPLHLAFYVSRPSLERLADQVAAGHAVVTTHLAGAYLIRGSAVNSYGDVSLILNPESGGPSQFVRNRSRPFPSLSSSPFGMEILLNLTDGWHYRVDD